MSAEKRGQENNSKKKRRCVDIIERDTEAGNVRPLNRRCGQFAVSRPDVLRQIWLLILN